MQNERIEMKRNLLYKTIAFTFTFILSTMGMGENSAMVGIVPNHIPEPLYEDIWGTIYHPVKEQCDDTPTITGDGSRINPYRASEHRWIAISQEMLNCEYRQTLVDDSMQFRGKISYGDTVWIQSQHPEINGWWVVRDAKNKRYKNSIDFLQTVGNGNLYNNNPMWNGKFENIRIYSQEDAKLLGYNPQT